jgi:hypothetical protein
MYGHLLVGQDEDGARRGRGRKRAPVPSEFDEDVPALPVTRLFGLVASGGFALWTRLTCFLC